MSDNQLNILDGDTTASASKRPQIERIYTSRGDNVYNHDGIKADKFFGIVIGGKIHWMNHTFATLRELSWQLGALDICMNEDGEWGVINEEGYATLSKKVTKIRYHHDEVFSDDTIYLKNAEFFKEGMIWWYMDDLKAKYFNETVNNTSDA